MWRTIAASRWLMLAAGVWIQCSAGSSYVFGLYSEAIKQSLGYNQRQLDGIGFLKDVGANVGVHSGLLYPLVPPWASLAIGAAHNFFGYFMLWLACNGKLVHVQYWQVCLFMFMAANAQVYLNTAVIVTSVKSFPGNRGTVIGLAKGFLGLSGAILTFIYQACHGTSSNQVSILLFLSLVPTATALLLMFLVRVFTPQDDILEKKTMYQFSGIALALAVCLMVYNLVSGLVGMSKIPTFIFRIILAIILASPLAVVLNSEFRPSRAPKAERLLGETHGSKAGTADRGTEVDEDERDFTLVQALSSLEFWLLFLACACGLGSGLTVVDNLNQLGSSLGYSQRHISTLVSLLSIWNFLGRFGAGLVSDMFLRSFGVPRPLFIVVMLGIMAAGHLVIAAAFPGALYIAIVIIGLGYGSHWSLMPAIASEIFGLKHFGTLFNAIATASPVATYLLSVRLAGWIYDREAESQGSSEGATSCTGAHCFRPTFLILAAVCSIGSLTTLVLVARTRRYYRQASSLL